MLVKYVRFWKLIYKEKVFVEKVRKYSYVYVWSILIMSYIIVNKCVFVSGRVFLIYVIYEDSFLCGLIEMVKVLFVNNV